MAQGDFSVSAPQVSQKRMRSRAVKMVSASCCTDAGLGLHEMQRDALGRARPDAGQFGERGDERGDGFGKHKANEEL